MRRVSSAVALGLLLAGCSLPGDEVGSAPVAPAAAHTGGVLRVGISRPGGIDPINAYEPDGKLVSRALCDTLVAIDADTGQLREAIGKRWVISSDGLITVKSRAGVRFTNGRTLTSKDINFSLQQLVAPANASNVRGLAGAFDQGSANKDGKQDVLADPSVRALDVARPVNGLDVQLQGRGDGGEIRALAEPATAPVSRTAYEADPVAFSAQPVCVGPYRLTKPYRSGDTSLELVRYDGYFAGNLGYTGGGKGYADTVRFTVYPNDAAAVTAYLKGEVDVVQVPHSQLSRVTREQGSLVFGPATAVEYLGLPAGGDSPLADPEVRTALSLALDRDRLVRKVFGISALPADGFVPPALAIQAGPSLGGRKEKAAPLGGCGAATPLHPDAAAAKARLKAAFSKEGARPLTGALVLEVNDDAPYPALAQEVAAQWRQVLGLQVKVVSTPWRDFVAKAAQGTGLTSAFRIRWASDATAPVPTYNDQSAFLAPLLYGASTSLGNLGHWNNRDFDFGLVEDAAPLSDVQQRGLAFAKLAKIACRQMPLIPLAFDRPTYLVRSSAVGSARALPVGRDGLLMLRELYLR